MTAAADPATWLERRPGVAGGRVRMFCLPFAGGSAAFYYPWVRALAPLVEVVPVQLPGRGRLADLPCAEDLCQLSRAVADALTGVRPHLPVLLYGHSMGAMVAYEVARCLQEAGDAVAHLVVTGRPAPHVRSPERPLSDLSRAGLVAVLRAYGATPEELLRDDDVLDILLPTLRADFRMIERYTHRPEPLLTCPITAVGGRTDPGVPAAAIHAWGRHGTGPFTSRMLPGGHFFPVEQTPELHALLREVSSRVA